MGSKSDPQTLYGRRGRRRKLGKEESYQMRTIKEGRKMGRIRTKIEIERR